MGGKRRAVKEVDVQDEAPKTIKRRKTTKTKELVAGKAKKLEMCVSKQTPFPYSKSPSLEDCRAVHAALSLLHHDFLSRVVKPKAIEDGAKAKALKGGAKPKHEKAAAKPKQEEAGGVLDSLVGTILSQNTTDVNSHRAFQALKKRFATWEEVRTAVPAEVEEAIRSGGLAAIKTSRIQVILNQLLEERGECSLEHMREMETEAVKQELTRFKGVGAKTVSCVLMFCLHRAEFPVDTHVWKIALALGWVPKNADRDQTYAHLNVCVPDDIKYDLHVLLVEHGKRFKNDVKVLRSELKALQGEGAAEGADAALIQAIKQEHGIKQEGATLDATGAVMVKAEPVEY